MNKNTTRLMSNFDIVDWGARHEIFSGRLGPGSRLRVISRHTPTAETVVSRPCCRTLLYLEARTAYKSDKGGISLSTIHSNITSQQRCSPDFILHTELSRLRVILAVQEGTTSSKMLPKGRILEGNRR